MSSSETHENGGERRVNGGERRVNGGELRENGGERRVNDGERRVNGGELRVNGGELRENGGERRENGTKLYWTVKNLSQWDIRLNGWTIDSPLFTIKSFHNCSWHLRLTPRGETESDSHLHVYLVLFAGELHEKINCEMLFMSGNECISSGIVESQSIGSRKSIKLSPCLLQEDVFHAKNKLFLPDDTLSIRCLVFRTNVLSIERISFKTDIFTLSKTFAWQIVNFSTLVLNNPAAHKEQFFINKKLFSTVIWHMSFQGNTLDNSVVQFALKASTNERLSIACELFVEKEVTDERMGHKKKRVVTEIVRTRKIFKQSRKYVTLNFPKSIHRRELLEYVQNDTLTVYGKVTFVTGHYYEEITHYGP